MIPLLRRVFATLGAWLGSSEPSDHGPYSSDGWLLPAASVLLALRRPPEASRGDFPAPSGRPA